MARVLILGGGTGGISVAARLAKEFPRKSLAIIEPSEVHHYQPLWTLVGGGVWKKEESQRFEKDFIPAGVEWIPDGVRRVHPETNEVELLSGDRMHYEFLVVATGLKLDFQKIEGLEGNLGRNGICTIYDYEGAQTTNRMLEEFRGGHALFIMPPVPIKCAGAPQKIMYLADDIFRRNGIREKTTVTFATAGKVIFGVPEFAQTLNKVVHQRGINTLYSHRLIGVKPTEKKGLFEISEETKTGTVSIRREEIGYDLLHVVPPMSAHNYVAESGLAFSSGPQAGWLEVDKFTLRHIRYPNIFGVGDVTGVPNSKTGAAIRKQAPLVVENLLAVISGGEPMGRYDGYSSCPLVTRFGKVVLAEFGYDGKLMPSFPFDQTKERRSMWLLKKHFLPRMYWHGMLRGRL